jgi:hypothetical protein
MRKVITITILIFLTSCASVLTSKDTFVGEWVISESSPSYSMIQDKQKLKDITITITKEDIFYKVSYGKEFEEIIMGDQQTELDKKVMENIFKYQLSPDKKVLISILDVSNVIMYNEDSGTITTQLGWFKRK